MKNVTRLARTLMLAFSALLMTSGVWAQTTLLTESFNGGVLPTGWTQTIVTGSTNWLFNAVGNNGTAPATTHSGAYNALLKYSGLGQKNDLVTSNINFTGLPIGTLTLWHCNTSWGGDIDSLTVFYRTSTTDTWKKIGQYKTSVTAWTQESISLPNPTATYQLKFRGCAEYGYGLCLDDILVQGMTAAPAPPVTITIGTGTTALSTYPYNTYWMDDKTQILYTAAEIDALGGAAGNITNFGLNISSAANYLMNGFTIQMAHTTSTGLSAFETPTWTTVYSTPMTISTTGWQNIALTTPFVWNGTDNLLVQICFHNTAYGSATSVVTSTTSFNSVYQHYQDNGSGCTMTTGVTATGRPNVRLTMPPKAGTLTGNVTNNYNGTPIGTATVTIQATPYAVFTNGSYMINYNVGTYNVTASAGGFLPKTKTVVIAQNSTTTVNFALDPIPAIISGVVTNAATGAPVLGAHVTFGTFFDDSKADGSYSINIYPGGVAGTIAATKLGFDNFVGTSVTPTPPTTYTQNIALMENVNVPGAVTATLNAGATAANISWGLPVGAYTLIYDDGKAENFAIWAVGGNKNAVKFTPVGYPATLTGGKVNIGTVDNYPAGSNPLVPFQIAVYDASGPGGTPGAELVAPFPVNPIALGFVNFQIAPLTITSGSFYIVMIQGGNVPNAAGIAVDTTSQQLRSYSRFGTGPWIPASGNFMIRANMTGSGGPLLADNSGQVVTASAVEGLTYATKPSTVTGTEGAGQVVFENGDSPESITGYQVYRLKQGDEGNPLLWTSVATPVVTNTVDASWPSLACGPYRWAVTAIYTGNRVSNATFSNVLGKCWTATVTVNIGLSCDSANASGTTVKLVNIALPDSNYTQVATASGVVVFNNVWKGNYIVTISKFNYITQIINPQAVPGDVTINVTLLQVKTPPTGLTVGDQTLVATWIAPQTATPLFSETWASGSFATNQWVASGANWGVSTTIGNPAPSAMFNWTPAATNYSQTLTSKSLTGVNSPVMKLKYDVFLNNYGNTTLEQMAVELWDGTTWHLLKNYDNSTGADIAWTSETVDVSAYTASTFKIRFRAYGVDSQNIDNWNFDNISVEARGPEGQDPCLIGYNFYLNNNLSATLPPSVTTYNIPHSQVQWGTVYNACVLAIYGSGYSPTSCYTFTSHFLYPATNIAGQGIDNAAYITWDKPIVTDSILDASPLSAIASGPAADVSPVQGIGTSPMTVPMNNTDATFDNGTLINSPGTGSGGADESIIEGSNYGSTVSSSLGYTLADDFTVPSGPGWDVNKFTFFVYQTNAPTTGSISACYFRLYNGSPMSGGTVVWGDLTTNMMTANVFSNIYRVTGANGGTARAIQKVECALPASHHLAPGTYWVEFVVAGNSSYSGPYGPYVVGTPPSAANALQSVSGTFSTLLDGSVPRSLPFEIVYGGISGATPPGLVGYNVYRDGAFRHFVNSPDTLHYYDFNLEPGTYCYDVTAKYDLTTYGFPGQFDESLVASNGPACVDVMYGRPLPFFEPWTTGNFGFNGWVTNGGNWSVNSGLGNPAPSADFSWQPIVNNYTQSIETPVLNASSFSCANIWLDFDLKLVDRNSTGNEKIVVDIYSGGTWKVKAEFANEGSINWTSQHIDLKAYAGKAFKVRFTASGDNSDDIIHWYVDNINVYGICKAPGFAPANISQSQFTTTLTWTAPVCSVPTQLLKLFQWSGTPDNGYYQNYGYGYGVVYDLTTYPDAVLNKIDFHHASWGTTGTWQYKIHVVDWASYTEVATLGPLTTTGNDIWENDILLGDIQGMGGHQVGIILEPMSNSATDAYPDFSADNIGPDGVSVFGDLANYAGMAPSGIGDFLQNLWVEVPLEDAMVTLIPRKVTVGELMNAPATRVATANTVSPDFLITNQGVSLVSPSDSSHVQAYNIYRTDETGTGAFTKINPTPVNALTYADVHPNTIPQPSYFKYYITALFEDSQNPGPVICEPASDTVSVEWPAVGVNNLAANTISLYPNPATDFVNVVSTSAIKSVEVINFLGQTIYSNYDVKTTTLKLDVQKFQTGVYFVKVTAAHGTKTTKITVNK